MISLGKKHGCITYPHPEIAPLVKRRQFECLSIRQADYAKLKNMENFRAFHLIRDPRDIIVSAYFSHRYSHETTNWQELQEHRQQLNSVSQEEGLLLEMEFGVTRCTLEALQNWQYSNAHILELKFEQFIIDPVQTFINIFSFFEVLDKKSAKTKRNFNWLNYYNKVIYSYRLLRPLKIPLAKIKPQYLKQIVKKYSFENMTGGRQRGQEDIKNHYRKGVPNDWTNYFTDLHKHYFKENYPNLLLKTGYERDGNW
ncbi:MAG: hypothetical protein RID53_00360 [Coleofasciculus sp. B1-GNL1-01]|uniref:sulfotransferase n=1 Tax=Coleofasciculus sp. B1-GNL1-01 TaxID=3068484 RepID=UPI0032F82B3C